MSLALPPALRAQLLEKVSAATGVRWQHKLRETGSIEPRPKSPTYQWKVVLSSRVLEALVAQDGDITLPELAGLFSSGHWHYCLHRAVPAQTHLHI